MRRFEILRSKIKLSLHVRIQIFSGMGGGRGSDGYFCFRGGGGVVPLSRSALASTHMNLLYEKFLMEKCLATAGVGENEHILKPITCLYNILVFIIIYNILFCTLSDESRIMILTKTSSVKCKDGQSIFGTPLTVIPAFIV